MNFNPFSVVDHSMKNWNYFAKFDEINIIAEQFIELREATIKNV